ncbi:MAG: class I SAM-dependent methyltransferase [Longimicrobiales bacterium]
MQARLEPDGYTAWFGSELGERVWRDERRALNHALGEVAGRTVLDVGAGDGRLARELAARGARVVALDRSADMLAAAGAGDGPGSGLTRVRADAVALPFPDGSFDRVIAVTVLCFADRPGEMIREMARVARPGGRVVLGELGRWSTWSLARRVRGWLGDELWATARFRTAPELRQLLARAGLRPGPVHGAVFYPRSVYAARLLGPVDRRFGRHTTIGAAFLAVAGVNVDEGSAGGYSRSGTTSPGCGEGSGRSRSAAIPPPTRWPACGWILSMTRPR